VLEGTPYSGVVDLFDVEDASRLNYALELYSEFEDHFEMREQWRDYDSPELMFAMIVLHYYFGVLNYNGDVYRVREYIQDKIERYIPRMMLCGDFVEISDTGVKVSNIEWWIVNGLKFTPNLFLRECIGEIQIILEYHPSLTLQKSLITNLRSVIRNVLNLGIHKITFEPYFYCIIERRRNPNYRIKVVSLGGKHVRSRIDDLVFVSGEWTCTYTTQHNCCIVCETFSFAHVIRSSFRMSYIPKSELTSGSVCVDCIVHELVDLEYSVHLARTSSLFNIILSSLKN
jgi:hypothetical protein